MAKSKLDTFTLKNGKSEIKLHYSELRKIVLVLRAINHDLRKTIVKLLSENDKMSVTQVYVALRLEQSVVSQHLAILRRAGIVNTDRQGKYIHYSLNERKLEDIAILTDALSVAVAPRGDEGTAE
jgi:DNA-binding transcriptional ArsR family regulator